MNLATVRAIEYWTLMDHQIGLCAPNEIGRKKPPVLEAKRLAQQATPMAIKALIDVTTQDRDPAAKVKAAQTLLDRGWGKATETIIHSSTELTLDQLRELPTEALKQMVLDQLEARTIDVTPEPAPESTT